MDRGASVDRFESLEQALGLPVFVCAAGWRPDIAVDLDEPAARVLIDHLESQNEREVALVLIGRGGHSGFADLLGRATRRFKTHAIIPYLATGKVALAALSCASVRIGRYGALGAVDAPTLGEGIVSPKLPQGSSSVPPEALDALSTLALGVGVGLGCDELNQIGVTAEDLSSAADEAAWELFQSYERALGLREPHGHRYRESEVGDEVEWEFASGIPGAFVESGALSTTFLLDTGKPDPDTGRFDGSWLLDESDEVLELDFENAKPV